MPSAFFYLKGNEMSEIQNKQQMIEYLDNGISGDIFKRFGVFSVNFRPFEKARTKEYERLAEFVEDEDTDDDEEIIFSKEVLEDVMRANISTVFHGMRFYFYSYEALKKFCEIVEK